MLRVVLFRLPSAEDGGTDPYEAELRASLGDTVAVEFVPLVSTAFVDSPRLEDAFVGDEGKRIVAVTSVTAARAVVNWTERDPIPRQNMLSSSVLYAVGKKAGGPLEEAGFSVLGASSGCASKLAEVIISDVKAGCEACFVVHPCGDLAMDTLGSACSAAGLPYYPVVVYTSVYEDGDVWRLLSEETRQCATGKSDRTVTVFAFFSPGGVKTVMDHSPSLRECLVSPVSSCLCASIGPTTAKSLQASGVSDSSIVVSQTPTPDGLACAICDVLKRTIV